MKQILESLNSNFFFLVKNWLESINSSMKLEPEGNIEIKYIDGTHYLTYPLTSAEEDSREDVQWTGTNSVIICDDDKHYVGISYNYLQSEKYAFELDSPYNKKGNI